MDNYYLIVFKNTHDAIEAENVLKNKNIKVTIMPTPTYITQSCGISIKFSEEYLDNIKKIIVEGKINIKNLYHKHDNRYEMLI